MSRDQWDVTISIGFEKENLNTILFRKELIANVSLLTGGCFEHFGNGYWREDGAEKHEVFCGEQHKERTVTLSTTVELAKWDTFYSSIKSAIKAGKKQHDINTSWVHVKRAAIVGEHFEV